MSKPVLEPKEELTKQEQRVIGMGLKYLKQTLDNVDISFPTPWSKGETGRYPDPLMDHINQCVHLAHQIRSLIPTDETLSRKK